jgi:hypothetical protein
LFFKYKYQKSLRNLKTLVCYFKPSKIFLFGLGLSLWLTLATQQTFAVKGQALP